MGSAGPWQEWRNKAIAPYGPGQGERLEARIQGEQL